MTTITEKMNHQQVELSEASRQSRISNEAAVHDPETQIYQDNGAVLLDIGAAKSAEAGGGSDLKLAEDGHVSSSASPSRETRGLRDFETKINLPKSRSNRLSSFPNLRTIRTTL